MRKIIVFKIVFLVLIFEFGLIACSSAPSSRHYSRVQAGTLQEVKFGTVLSIRRVLISKGQTDIGTTSGALIGGIAGSEVGRGKGAIVGAIAGAVLGGLAGSAIDKNTSDEEGLEITVKMDSGRTVAVTQLADESFQVGDRIKILEHHGRARVAH